METSVDSCFQLKTNIRSLLSDTLTPVSTYLRLRDHYKEPLLLESNDFSSAEACYSIIALDPLATIQIQHGSIRVKQVDGSLETTPVVNAQSAPDAIYSFLKSFDVQYDKAFEGVNGIFGHTNFDGVQYFDTMAFDAEKRKYDTPDIRYSLYRFVLLFNHFKQSLTILENLPEGEESQLDKLVTHLQGHQYDLHPFKRVGEVYSNLTDAEFMELVRIGKHHCQIGDVFQIVFSRQFAQDFQGDEFTVYRVLRSINPSPYLFFFDYGDYKIFGSSPESQMVIQDGQAVVNPIAGTYRRTGDAAQDAQKAIELSKDPKENAEHIMLVDLARNDLGRHAVNVRVEELKAIHYYSHVIHLVSTVVGDLPEGTNPVQVFGDTFPAGTLSGAPKYKAIELINHYENQNRSFYGGGLGFIDFNGGMTQCIVIRSFMSLGNTLYFQAGAGIVQASKEESELQEVNNKLGALNKALLEAETLISQ